MFYLNIMLKCSYADPFRSPTLPSLPGSSQNEQMVGRWQNVQFNNVLRTHQSLLRSTPSCDSTAKSSVLWNILDHSSVPKWCNSLPIVQIVPFSAPNSTYIHIHCPTVQKYREHQINIMIFFALQPTLAPSLLSSSCNCDVSILFELSIGNVVSGALGNGLWYPFDLAQYAVWLPLCRHKVKNIMHDYFYNIIV